MSNEFRIVPMIHTTLIYNNDLVGWINHYPWHLLCLYMYNYYIILQIFFEKNPNWYAKMDGWKIIRSTLIQKFKTTFTQMMCRKCKQDGMKLWCSLNHGLVSMAWKEREEPALYIARLHPHQLMNRSPNIYLSFHLLGLTTYRMKRRRYSVEACAMDICV